LTNGIDSLRPYRPLQNQTAQLPEIKVIYDQNSIKTIKPVLTWDVSFAVWCGKVLNWFGRILIWCGQVLDRQARRGHKFIAAHIFGFVLPLTKESRELTCFTCPHQKIVDGFESCNAENCGCGHWQLANLRHKRRLSGYRCVEGRFGYGLLAKWWHGERQPQSLVVNSTIPFPPPPPVYSGGISPAPIRREPEPMPAPPSEVQSEGDFLLGFAAPRMVNTIREDQKVPRQKQNTQKKKTKRKSKASKKVRR